MNTNNNISFGYLSKLINLFAAILILLIFVNILYAKERYAYIANSGNGIITIVDLDSLTTRNLYIGGNPRHIKKVPGYDQLWIYQIGYRSNLIVIDPISGSNLFEEPINYLKSLTISSSGTIVYVAYEDNPVKIKVFDTDDFSEVKNFSISNLGYLQDFCLSSNDQILYALHNNNFYFIDANDGDIIDVIALSKSANQFIVSPDEQYAYANGGYYDLQQINLKTFTVNTKSTNREISALAISPDGKYLYTSIEYSNSVTVYDASTLNQIATISVSTNDVTDLRVSSDGNRLYVLNENDPNFEIYNAKTGSRLTSIYTGSNTYQFDFDFAPSDSIPPQPISNLQMSQIYSDGALLTWTAAYDDSATEPVRGYEVRYDTVAISNIDSATIYEHSVKPSSPGQIDSLRMTGLTGETNFFVAIRTYDEAKNYSNSVTAEFVTLQQPNISVSPQSYDFTVSIGDSIDETFTITNSGGENTGALDYKISRSGIDSSVQFAFVANSSDGTISKIDLIHSTIRDFNIDNSPHDIKKSPISDDLWIADQNKGLLIILDSSTGKVKYSFYLQYIKKILFSTDGGYAYILYGNYSPWIKVYDTRSMTEVSNFKISSYDMVYDFCISVDGQTIYTVIGNYFYLFNAFNGTTINSKRVTINSNRITISPDGQYCYLYGKDTYIQKVDLQTLKLTHQNNVGGEVNAFAISPDGNRCYVGFYNASSITIYNAGTLTQISSITTNNDKITDLKVSPDEKQLFILHWESPNFQIYDIETNSQIASYSTGNRTYRFDICGGAFPFIDINPLSGTISGGESAEISLFIDCANLLHKKYDAEIIVESNDPNNPTTILPVTIQAQDTIGPDFNLSFFMNPYLTNYLKVVIFAHEYLTEFPTLVVGDSMTLPLSLQDSTYHIYLATYKLTSDEDVTFTVTGSDSVGNIITFERTLHVTKIPLSKQTFVSNNDGSVTIEFPCQSFEHEMFVILWEETDIASKQTIHHLGPESMKLNKPAMMEIDYSELEMSNMNQQHLSIYQQKLNGHWEKITTQVDKKRKSLVAEIIQLGTFKIGYDESTFSEEVEIIPAHYSLKQNHPNPFNPSTTIYYTLPEAQIVTLKVYNILGREVATLVDTPQQAGNHYVHFSADRFAGGIYFYQIKAGDFIETRKMILMK